MRFGQVLIKLERLTLILRIFVIFDDFELRDFYKLDSYGEEKL